LAILGQFSGKCAKLYLNISVGYKIQPLFAVIDKTV